MINGDPKLESFKFKHGDTIDNFDVLLDNYKKLKHIDFEGSTWAHLIHKDLWVKVGDLVKNSHLVQFRSRFKSKIVE